METSGVLIGRVGTMNKVNTVLACWQPCTHNPYTVSGQVFHSYQEPHAQDTLQMEGLMPQSADLIDPEEILSTTSFTSGN